MVLCKREFWHYAVHNVLSHSSQVETSFKDATAVAYAKRRLVHASQLIGSVMQICARHVEQVQWFLTSDSEQVECIQRA